jgi:hypothetical protein
MSRTGKLRAKKTPAPKRHVPPLGMSIDEFCDCYGFKRNLFYELVKAGKGPDIMQLGRRRIITTAAAERWAREREAESAV